MAALSASDFTAECLRKLQVHEEGLVKFTYDRSLTNFKTFSGVTYRQYWLQVMSMLPAFNRNVLEAVIRGNLPQKVKADPALAHELKDRLVGGNGKFPAIYGNYIVRANGEPLSPRELLKVCGKMREYVNSVKYAGELDEKWAKEKAKRKLEATEKRGRPPKPWTASQTTTYKRYVAGDAIDEQAFGTTRATNIVKFVTSVENLFKGIPPSSPLWDLPVARALAEFGWAAKVKERLDEHEKFAGSNYIMTLFRVILELEFKDIKYSFEQYVLYFVFDGPQGAIAESFITDIGLGYIEQGYGFSHWPAGQNNSSAGATPAVTYAMLKGNYLKQVDYQAKLEDMLKRRQERLDLIERQKAAKARIADRDDPETEEALRQKLIKRKAELDQLSAALSNLAAIS